MTKKGIYLRLLKCLLPAARNLQTHLKNDVIFQTKKNRELSNQVFDILLFVHHIPTLLLSEEEGISASDLHFLEHQCEDFLASEVGESAYGEEPRRLIESLRKLANTK